MSLPDFALAGAYGCTTKPALKNNIDGVETEFPNNVTKIFFNTRTVSAKNEKEKIQKNMSKVRNLLKNNAYRANAYTRKYRKRNLPLNLQQECPKIPGEANLEMLRFPYLGIDLLNPNYPNHIYSMILQIPIHTLLEQMLKLMKHVQIIRDSGYIHGDIRMENVMIHPVTGKMTIIDFDFFQPANIFFEKYMGKLATEAVNVPPEVFLYLKRHSKQVIRKYFRQYIDYYDTTFRINPSYLSPEKYNVLPNIEIYYQESETKLTNNNPFMSHQELQEKLKIELAKYIDSYGLGMTLMHFLATIYGSIIRPEPLTDKEYSECSEIFTKYGSTSYTRQQIILIANTLQQVARDILFPLAHFSLPRRLDISVAVPMMEAKLGEFQTEWSEITPLPASPVASRAPSPPTPFFGPLNAFNSADEFKGGRKQKRNKRKTMRRK
jgi:serine/threonine protein kinase